MSDGRTIAGRKNGYTYDLYETPAWATQTFVDAALRDGVLTPGEFIYDCCSGAGAIIDVLKANGFGTTASDIQVAPYIVGDQGVDVYELEDDWPYTIMTNPPYKLMTDGDMLKEFLRIGAGKVILLLNIYFLSSQKRKEMLKASPLKYVYVHSGRVTMYPYGEEKPKNGGTKMYAWFVWERGYEGEPVIRYL